MLCSDLLSWRDTLRCGSVYVPSPTSQQHSCLTAALTQSIVCDGTRLGPANSLRGRPTRGAQAVCVLSTHPCLLLLLPFDCLCFEFGPASGPSSAGGTNPIAAKPRPYSLTHHLPWRQWWRRWWREEPGRDRVRAVQDVPGEDPRAAERGRRLREVPDGVLRVHEHRAHAGGGPVQRAAGGEHSCNPAHACLSDRG